MLDTETNFVDCARAYPRFYWRLVDESLLVVELNTFEFTLLNGTAAMLWLSLLDQERALGDLTAILAETSDRPIASTNRDIARILAEWRTLGWLVTDDHGRCFIKSRTDRPPPAPYKIVSRDDLENAVSDATLEWRKDMDFMGTPVGVRFLCDAGHVRCDASVRSATFLAGLPACETRSENPISCYMTGNGLFLRLGYTCVQASDVSDALSRMVLWCFYLAYGETDFLGTFHAAAIGRAQGAILMPGVSGVGKSTLTAYLAGQGWRYGGDDIVGLSRPFGNDKGNLVLPFCSAISVKAGAVSLLDPFYPDLAALPQIHYDTKSARFPVVPHAWQMNGDVSTRRIQAIVFPHFGKHLPTELTPLTTSEALLALVGVGYRTGEKMDAVLLHNLFDFLEDTPKYRLEFCDLEAADETLRSVLCP